MKKVISIFLAFLMIVTAVPLTFAEEGPQAETQTDYNIDGDNSFGQMMGNALETNDADADTSYNISNVTVEGQTATVSFNNAAACTLVVAAYDEDTGRMLCSASLKVEENAKEASVTLSDLSANNIIVKAFLLDENFNALCKAYTFNELTKAYKEFMAKDINDFDEEKVINLDDSIDNNFLVLSDDVIRVEKTEETNFLVSSDFEQNRFTFANADNAITNLKSGDLFYYDNGDYENMIIVSVKSISEKPDGSVTVIGETIDLESAFQFIHIDVNASDFALDESTVGEHMRVYEASSDRPMAPKRIGVNVEHKFDKTWGFEFDRKFYTNGTEAKDYDDETASVKFSGSGNFGCEADFKIYLGSDCQDISIVFTPRIEIDFSLKGSISKLNVPLGEYEMRALGVLKFSLNPKIVIKGSLEVSTKVTAGFSVGVSYNMQDGFVNKCEWPTVEFEGIKVTGTLFVGLDLNPKVSLLSDEVAEADMSGEAGVEVKASSSWLEQTWGKTNIHLCNNCIGGNVKLKINLKANLSFANNKTWGKRKSFDIAGFSFDICEFYWSITFGDHGLGKCPHQLTDKNKYNGHYYLAFDESLSWTEAKDYCENLGGHLATVTSQGEQNFIVGLFNESNGYYLGGSDAEIEGNWTWITGEQWQFDNWFPGEPNNAQSGTEHYLEIYTAKSYGTGKYEYNGTEYNTFGCWNDHRGIAMTNIGFICEWEDISAIKKVPKETDKKVLALDSFNTVASVVIENNTATKSDVVSGLEYVLLIVKDDAADDLLAADNVLYIDQKTAEKHMVSFTFSQREDYDNPSINIYGPSQVHEHSYISLVTQEPTCTQPGVMTYTCVDEDDSYTEEIPATGVHIDADRDGVCDLCKQPMPDEDQSGEQGNSEEACQYCHQVHGKDVIGRLTKFFHNILYFFAHLFGRM